MSEPISPEQERQYAERFNAGQSPATPQEAKIHNAYRKFDSALRTMSVPNLGHASLAARMATEAKSLKRQESKKTNRFAWDFLDRVPTPVFATVCAVLICLLTISYAYVLQTPESPFVRSFSMFDIQSQEIAKASWSWGFRIQRSQTVTVPPNSEARLELADGSYVRCTANTRLAFSTSTERRIELVNGTVYVTAKSGLERPLQVVTDLGIVEVKGTEFRVSVIR